jgi:hypothetical protein
VRLKRPLTARTALLAMVLALVLGGCTSVRQAVFTPLTDTRYPPRAESAAVAEEPAEALPDRGYVLVGIVEARAPVRVCAVDGCVPADHPPDPTASARNAAAAGGGDLIALELDAVLIREPLEERGDCLEMIRPMREGDSLCSQWEWKYGVRESRITRGTVWRLEPDLAANGANRLAHRVFDAGGSARTPRTAEPETR